MKRILTILFLICTLSVYSQDDRDGSRIEALKIAYLTTKLNLSPDEAQRFWPIYNNYAGEIRQARIDQKKNKISEIQTEERILGIRKKYNTEFSKALNPEKINKFFRSEKEFGSYLQKELTERRQQKQLQLNKDRIKR